MPHLPRSLRLLTSLLFLVAACSREQASTDDDRHASSLPEPPPAMATTAPEAALEHAPGEAETDTVPQATAPLELPEGLVPIDGPGLIALIQRAPGKAVLVNVWASWCGACEAELPMMLEMKKKYAPLGIGFAFVSVDRPNKAEDALAFLKQHDLPSPGYLVVGRLGPFKHAMSPKWPGSLPASFLFDTTGKLRYFWGAHVYEDELVPILDGFLAGKNIDGVANVRIRRGSSAPE